MIIKVKSIFMKNDPADKKLYPIVRKALEDLQERLNKGDFNVYCYDRDDEQYIMGDYELEDDVLARIEVEGNDIYKNVVMNTIEGSKHFSNYINN